MTGFESSPAPAVAVSGGVRPTGSRSLQPVPHMPWLAAAAATAASAALLVLDRLPRFFHEDMTAYLAGAAPDWTMPGRSWAYGHAVRFLTVVAGSTAAVPVAQGAALLAGLLLACRVLAGVPGARWGLPVFALLAALNPLGQVYARFWLADALAAPAFLAFLVLLGSRVDGPRARFWRAAPWLALLATMLIATRPDQAAIGAGALLIAAGSAALVPSGARPPRLRRTLLALAGALAVACAVHAPEPPPSSESPFSSAAPLEQFTRQGAMTAFLPALRRDDFTRAGVPLTISAFERLDLGNRTLLGLRLRQDGEGTLRQLVPRRLAPDNPDGARADGEVLDAYAAMLRSALRDHPQTFAATYFRGLASIFEPGPWRTAAAADLNLGQPLPAWVTDQLAALTGRPTPPDVVMQASPLAAWLLAVAGVYSVILLAGQAIAVVTLLFGRPFGPRHLLAAGLTATLLAAPFAGPDLHPRYFLAGIPLALLLLTLTLLDGATYVAFARLVRRSGAAAQALAASPALPAAVAGLCVVAYAGQLGLARWQTDEFALFATQRDGGWDDAVSRLRYSPRPLSEAVLFLYGLAVNGWGRPLIVPFLTVLWTAVLVCAGLAALAAVPGARSKVPATLALALVPFAFVLATNPVTETFYWPMAAAAYLPVGGSAAVLLFLTSRPLDARARRWCCAALLVAAASCEIGAALAAGFMVAAAVEGVTRPDGLRGLGRGLERLRAILWWLLPGVLGACVLAAIIHWRAHVVELGADAQPYTGRLLPAAGLTALQFVLDLAGADAGMAPVSILGAAAAKLALAVGMAVALRRPGHLGAPWRQQTVLAASLAASASFSVLAAYYHYGALCCERHATTRHWLMDLLLVLGACGLVNAWRPLGRLADGRPWLAPVLLTLSLLPVLGRIEGLRQDYGVLTLTQKGIARTWQSGQRAGTSEMEFYLPAERRDMLVRGTFQPIGTYLLDAGDGAPPPDMILEVGRFFRKRVVFVCQPWQQATSRTLYGQFIPACPPRAEPPDTGDPSP